MAFITHTSSNHRSTRRRYHAADAATVTFASSASNILWNLQETIKHFRATDIPFDCKELGETHHPMFTCLEELELTGCSPFHCEYILHTPFRHLKMLSIQSCGQIVLNPMFPTEIRYLSLRDLRNISDEDISKVIECCPKLHFLDLRGLSDITVQSVENIKDKLKYLVDVSLNECRYAPSTEKQMRRLRQAAKSKLLRRVNQRYVSNEFISELKCSPDIVRKYSNVTRSSSFCTTFVTGFKATAQYLYTCKTCKMRVDATLCSVCAFRCHRSLGHEIQLEGIMRGFCDCGPGTCAFEKTSCCKSWPAETQNRR
mmetsp:Transcript_30450/g.48875  ORF Transcript_30450/g.48875 Transcript_30450/m.48875 type:complete len:313 (-) Transcript_30450:348-1286(-)